MNGIGRRAAHLSRLSHREVCAEISAETAEPDPVDARPHVTARPRGRRHRSSGLADRPACPGQAPPHADAAGPDRLVLRPAGAGAAAAGPECHQGAFQRRRRAVLAPSRRTALHGPDRVARRLAAHAGARPPHRRDRAVRADAAGALHRPAGRARAGHRGLRARGRLSAPRPCDDRAPGRQRPVAAAACGQLLRPAPAGGRAAAAAGRTADRPAHRAHRRAGDALLPGGAAAPLALSEPGPSPLARSGRRGLALVHRRPAQAAARLARARPAAAAVQHAAVTALVPGAAAGA